jgi:predicted naringenin-chalcone synthase
VPNAIQDGLHAHAGDIVGGAAARAIDLWAVHPGGRTVLDAVERALGLGGEALTASRSVLRRYGNMSSATVMFVLDELLRAPARGAKGCAMSFGPGLSAEIMAFRGA